MVTKYINESELCKDNNNHNDDFKIHVNDIDGLMKELGVEGAGSITLTTSDGRTFTLDYKGSGSNLTSGNDLANKENLGAITLACGDKQINLTLTTHGKGNIEDSTTGQDQYWIEYTTPSTKPEGTPGGSTTPEGGSTTPEGGNTTPEGGNTTPEGGSTTPGSGENGVTITDNGTPLHSGSSLMAESASIAEEEVPLAELPGEEAPLAELPDEEVPMAQAPETGDAALLWAMMSALSGMALAGLTISTRKTREENA